jgi:hypothetical protein
MVVAEIVVNTLIHEVIAGADLISFSRAQAATARVAT